ncbi:MAG TPA: tetratricopeptide repeat protein, partial [Verrucomicrobiales bacterium]|nr:tetratricopeptide repeat protein [Verrucomicrobiales bacterium]
AAEPIAAEPIAAEPIAAELPVPPPMEPVVATVPPSEKKSSLLTGHTGPVKLSALFASLSEQDMVPPVVPVAPVMRFGSPEPVHTPAGVEPLGVIGENGLEPVTAIAGPEPVASVVSLPDADDSEMEHLGTIGDDEWEAWSGTATTQGTPAGEATLANQPTGESVQSARLSVAKTSEVSEPSVSFEQSPEEAVPAPTDSDVNRTFGDLAPFFAGRDRESAKLSPLPRASGTVPGKVQPPVESLPPAEKRKVWEREPGDSADLVEAAKLKSAGWLFGGRETMDPPPGGIAPPYGFGERLMTQKTFAGSDHALFPKDEEEKPTRNLTRFWLVGMAILAVLGVAGVFLGQYISRFAGAIALEAHAEMLLPAHYTVQMEVSDALEDSLSQATGILPNLNDLGKGIAPEKPSPASTPSGDAAEAMRDRAAGACQAARAARNRGEYAEAVGHYLEALRADSRQSDALKEIWATTREWQAAGAFEMTSGQLAQVEQTAREVPIAASLLAEYLLPRDPADGLRWLVRSAEAGHPPHMVRLGRLFAGGKVVPRDLPTAAAWFRKAAEKGDASGQFYYSECLIFGRGLPESVFPGYDFLKKAQQGGESRAWNLMGTCHINGWGCQRDKIEALRCFEKAAESRDPGSYYNLGVRYAKGDGASRDLAKAADCFRQGAEAGDAFTMHIYAECLGLGFGVEASPVASQGWHVKAAQAGSSESQAWCDAHGVPVPE